MSATLDRLTAAEAAGQLSGESAGELREVFELLLRLRLERQVAQVERGQPPTNSWIRPSCRRSPGRSWCRRSR